MITLRDIDNRDDDGGPYEFSGTTDQICGYLDGPLRGDLRDASSVDVDSAIAAVRAADLATANKILNRDAGVYLPRNLTCSD